VSSCESYYYYYYYYDYYYDYYDYYYYYYYHFCHCCYPHHPTWVLIVLSYRCGVLPCSRYILLCG